MTDIEVIGDDKLVAGSRFLSLWERTVKTDGKTFPYFLAARGQEPPPPHSEKKPDAVVVVAFWHHQGERRLLLTSEYRIPIGVRELGFPAGLIDEPDYGGGNDYTVAARGAAIREVKEETGFDFTPTEVSPNNLYSSPGMTNESVVYVFGFAEQGKDGQKLDTLEDIKVESFSHAELVAEMDKPEAERDYAFGKTSWPFLWAFKYSGFCSSKTADCPHSGFP